MLICTLSSNDALPTTNSSYQIDVFTTCKMRWRGPLKVVPIYDNCPVCCFTPEPSKRWIIQPKMLMQLLENAIMTVSPQRLLTSLKLDVTARVRVG